MHNMNIKSAIHHHKAYISSNLNHCPSYSNELLHKPPPITLVQGQRSIPYY